MTDFYFVADDKKKPTQPPKPSAPPTGTPNKPDKPVIVVPPGEINKNKTRKT